MMEEDLNVRVFLYVCVLALVRAQVWSYICVPVCVNVWEKDSSDPGGEPAGLIFAHTETFLKSKYHQQHNMYICYGGLHAEVMVLTSGPLLLLPLIKQPHHQNILPPLEGLNNNHKCFIFHFG